MKKLSLQAVIGYPAGIITGVTYGMNPLFAMPLLNNGAAVESVLFYRYAIALVLLGIFLRLRKHSFRVTAHQGVILFITGLFFSLSSLFLFEAYKYIPSGLATTLVFLYPVLVAIIMVFLKVVPSWPVWISIFATFAGVAIMTYTDEPGGLNPVGMAYAIASALVYAFVLVIINRNKSIANVSNTLLTFYTLAVGTVLFLIIVAYHHSNLTTGLDGVLPCLNLIGLAILPTIVSTATLAIATRNIGATKASVLGVFEPITAILIGTLVFGEALTPAILFGILISVTAITFMIMVTKR